MNRWTLIRRSAWFYRRTHGGVIAGAALAGIVLTGALIVGDCLRATLHGMATARLGGVQLALTAPNATLDSALLSNFARTIDLPVAGVLQYRGMVRRQGGGPQACNVQINGVASDFWRVGGVADPLAGFDDGIAINSHLARKLNLRVGDVVIVRLPRPSALSMDMPIGSAADPTVLFSQTVRAVVNDAQFGRFSLYASQVAALNVFLPLRQLAGYARPAPRAEPSGKANLLLVGGAERQSLQPAAAQQALDALAQSIDLYGYHLEPLSQRDEVRLMTERVFFDPAVVSVMQEDGPPGDMALTYLANEMRIGDRAAPYAMVCAYGGLRRPNFCRPIHRTLGPNEIVLNQWLADDLHAKIGDALALKYDVVANGRRLIEQTHTFTVAAIVPMEGLGADPTLMPDFAGITDSDDMRDWKPGFHIDLSKIRDLDERYWDKYRGAPKAFVNLATGRRLWGNRWGDVTQMRFGATDAQAVSRIFSEKLRPEQFGLVFQPVRRQALQAAAEGQDFTGLFVGLSFFIIVAAMLLTALMFVFGIEQRAGQIGTMLSIGFTPRRIAMLLMGEGLLLAAVGVVVGTIGAIGYAWGVLKLLAGVWHGAVGTAELVLVVRPSTLLSGAAMALCVCLLAMALTLRRQLKRSPRELLGGPAGISGPRPRGGWSAVSTTVCLVAAVGLAIFAGGGAEGRVMAFFGSGTLVLIGAIFAASAWLGRLVGRVSNPTIGLRQMGRRNCARRRGRSLAVVTLLATGLFMLVAVCANTKVPPADPDVRAAPTGGFELYGESALPVYHDLNTVAGRKPFGLTAEQMAGVTVVALRVRDGDDASCLNLNRPQQPRLIGAPIATLKRLRPFTVVASLAEASGDSADPWKLLQSDGPSDGIVPAFVDAGTAQWILKKTLGQTLVYTDDRGQPFKVKIVGLLNDTIMQGAIVIAEQDFIDRFPDIAGYRAFLIDTPPGRTDQVQAALADRLADVGFDGTRTTERLASFNAVQNTYLAIFAALGGLGMILGSVGLGVVAARNIFERRGELALMRAVGFGRRDIGRMLIAEHDGLLLWGVGGGVIAAMVAVAPALMASNAQPPYELLIAVVALVGISGVAWIRLAGRWATRGALLEALREE